MISEGLGTDIKGNRFNTDNKAERERLKDIRARTKATDIPSEKVQERHIEKDLGKHEKFHKNIKKW